MKDIQSQAKQTVLAGIDKLCLLLHATKDGW